MYAALTPWCGSCCYYQSYDDQEEEDEDDDRHGVDFLIDFSGSVSAGLPIHLYSTLSLLQTLT